MSIPIDFVGDELDFIRAFMMGQGYADADSAIAAVKPDWFIGHNHQKIWSGIMAVIESGGIADPFNVEDAMVSLGYGGPAIDYLRHTLFGDSLGSDRVTSLATATRVLHERKRRRDLERQAEGLGIMLADPTVPVCEIERRLDEMRAAEEVSGRASLQSYEDLFRRAASGQSLMEGEMAKNRAVFGIPTIDRRLCALPRRLGVVAAKPSAGKTTFINQSLVRTALTGRHCALVGLESDREESAAAFAAHLTDIDRGKLLTEGEAFRYTPDFERLSSNLFGYHVGSCVDWRQVESVLRRRHRTRPLDYVVVDYFTLLETPDIGNRNTAWLYGQISKSAKRLAQDLGCCLILVSQFNREVDDDEEPFLRHLRETGQLEQDADFCVFLWSGLSDNPDGTRDVSYKFAKNRGGVRDVRGRMKFHPAKSKFIEMERLTDERPRVKKGFTS